MSVSRRTVLAAAGGTLALVAAGGLWRVTRQPQTAAGPWALPSPPPADVRLDAFRHAILAPNPHNRQPWIIRLDGTDGATLFADPTRLLPETDPFNRQIMIGFGAFLELARIAAAERGMTLLAIPFPEGAGDRLDARPVASLQFVPRAPGADPLFAAIRNRRSNKEVYDLTRPVSDPDLAAVFAAAGVSGGSTAGPEKVKAIRALVLQGADIEMQLPRTHRESVDVMRIGAREVDANPDGIDISGPMIEALAATGAMNRRSMADPASQAFKAGADMIRETYGSATAFVWLTTPANDRASQLATGAAYARLNLAATSLGLAMHPMSQTLQEFPEMAGSYAAIHRLLAPDGARVQMLARIGHGPKVGPSPRWPLEAKLV